MGKKLKLEKRVDCPNDMEGGEHKNDSNIPDYQHQPRDRPHHHSCTLTETLQNMNYLFILFIS